MIQNEYMYSGTLQQLAEFRIQRGEFEINNPKKFLYSLNQTRFPEMLMWYTEQELLEMELFLVAGLRIGFALKKRDDLGKDIVALHNNEHRVRDIGVLLLQQAVIREGLILIILQPINSTVCLPH